MTGILPGFSAIGGAVRLKNICHLITASDSVDQNDQPHAYAQIFLQDKRLWGTTTKPSSASKVPWTVISSCVCSHPLSQFVAIGAWGNALIDGKGDFHEELIHDPSMVPPNRRGKFQRVRGIGQKAYAVGMGRTVYRRDDAHQWTAIDGECLSGGLQPDNISDVEAYKAMLVGFNSIDGFSETDIYAVGLQGEIWHFDGKRWRQLDSPTNRILNDVVCAGDGQVYACGDAGCLLRGRDDNWSIITDEAFTRDIWNLCWFADRLFIATTQGLFFLNDKGQVKPVDFGGNSPKTTYHLSARDGIMWSIGAKDIMQFDGTTWTRID